MVRDLGHITKFF